MNVIKKIFLIVFLSFSISVLAQQEKFKAVLIFNFTKYIEWSPEEKQGNFIIAVVGSQEMVKHLEIIASKMKVGNQPIEVKYYNSFAEIGKCHLVYISPYKSNEVNSQLNKNSKSLLIVTDKNGMIQQGSGINFFSKNGEVKFEISKNNIEKNGLKINPALLLLGKSS